MTPEELARLTELGEGAALGGKKGNPMKLGAYAKAAVATATAVVGGLVQATQDGSAHGAHVSANEWYVILGVGLAALALTYAVPNKAA